MACMNNLTVTTNPNSILELIKKIDQAQKEALLHNYGGVCDICLLKTMYNTKPISVFIGDEELRTRLNACTDMKTHLYRIEEVRGNETVCLRLLKIDDGHIVCTNQTVVVKISCICCVECYEAVNLLLFDVL